MIECLSCDRTQLHIDLMRSDDETMAVSCIVLFPAFDSFRFFRRHTNLWDFCVALLIPLRQPNCSFYLFFCIRMFLCFYFCLRALFTLLFVRAVSNTEKWKLKQNTGKFVDASRWLWHTIAKSWVSRGVKSNKFYSKNNSHDERTIVHRMQTPRLCPNEN